MFIKQERFISVICAIRKFQLVNNTTGKVENMKVNSLTGAYTFIVIT